jgi:sulfatase maturation enzyme AslB (radical SAM superfamily)
MWMAVRDANVLELNRRYRERWEKVEDSRVINVQIAAKSLGFVEMAASVIDEQFKGRCNTSRIFYDPRGDIYRCYVKIRFNIKGVDI